MLGRRRRASAGGEAAAPSGKPAHSFTSYIGLEAAPTPDANGGKNGAAQELKPKLLNGELVAGAAHNVVMLTPLSEREQGKMGSLFVTNYKLTFVPIDPTNNEVSCQHNTLLGPFDVSLSSVGALWLTDTGPLRRRRLLPFGAMPGKVKGLQIICKNMKVITFIFKYSPIGQGRTIAMALIHHAFPKRHDLLFAYEYREPYYPTITHEMNMFLRPGDWKRELERCECPYWRITCINGTSDAFMSGANETLIVPSSALDFNLIEASRHFRGGRVPVWVWGRADGAALLRSGELLQTEQSATAESVLLEQVRRSHPKLTAPHIMYLCGNSYNPSSNASMVLPPLGALLASYKKLSELCTPPTLRIFWEQDSQYYSFLEASRWLRHVATCLALADEAAQRISDNVTVVLQEGDGVDYCAVVSCLTQLVLDPHSRSIAGFQSLIQKEWIALGHPFCDRLGHITPSNPKDKESAETIASAPVLLLFLDCVWQLQNQFPSSFQFTETYLTTLWDCAHNQLFDTFIFNCPRDRDLAVAKNLIQRPVWDWGEQFTEKDTMMFHNPLYTNSSSNQRISQSPTSSRKYSDLNSSRLRPCTSVAGMELWSQCYERWLPPLDAPAGGPVQYQIHNNAVLHQIHDLKEKLVSMPVSPVNHRHSNGRPESAASHIEPTPRQLVSRFYPFSAGQTDLSPGRSLDSMQVSLIDASQLLDSLSLLNAPD